MGIILTLIAIKGRINKFIGLLVILFAILAGYLIGSNSNVKSQNFSTANKLDVATPTGSSSKPLGFFTSVETPKRTIYLFVDQDFIDFNPVETPYHEKAPIIKKTDYPKLFKQGIANYSALRVEYDSEKSKEGKTFIKLSNNQPDHGSFSEVYSILVDPFSGEIIEKK